MSTEQRHGWWLSGGIGIVVLLLAAMGVYGVVALAVTHRTAEIGLRIAVGATRGGIVRRVLWDAVRVSAPGMLVGALVASGTGVALHSMLLGMTSLDPVSLSRCGRASPGGGTSRGSGPRPESLGNPTGRSPAL